MILTVILEGISKAPAVLSVLMKVCTIPCHDRGYCNVVLVLQSCSDSLHILPGASSKTNAASDGVCNFSNIENEEDVDVIEEIFISINEEVDRGIKQEIPGDITFPDIKSEPEEVSYVCICGLLLDTFYKCPDIIIIIIIIILFYFFFIFICQYSWPIETAPLLAIKMVCWLFFFFCDV